MDIKKNFVSTVVIGRFNPSILTVEFLKNECGIEIGEGTIVTPPVPVTKEIHFEEEGIEFFADLERLQVKELQISNIEETQGPGFVKIYLEKLPYTPIVACGINFAYSIHLEEAYKKTFQAFLSDETIPFDLFKIDNFSLDTERSYAKNGDIFTKLWNLTFELKKGLKSAIRIASLGADNIYSLNHNIEAPNLNKDRDRLSLITDNLGDNIAYHKYIIDNFIKGVKDV